MAADEEVTETNQTHKGLRWLDVGIILAVAPIVVASLRVVIFTGGDPVLTQVLIENLDVRTLLLGSFFSILPAMAMVASSFLMVEKSLAGRLLGGDKKGRRRWGTLIGGIILLLVVFSNLMWIAAALVVVPIILFVISFVSFLGEKLERERVKNSWKDIFNVQKGLSTRARQVAICYDSSANYPYRGTRSIWLNVVAARTGHNPEHISKSVCSQQQ